MTNGEYLKKHRRGSSPSRHDEIRFTTISDGSLSAEAWKKLTWYPVSSTIVTATESRNTLPNDNTTKEEYHG